MPNEQKIKPTPYPENMEKQSKNNSSMQKVNKKINLEFVSERVDIDDDKKTTKCTLTFKPHFKEFAELYGRPSDVIINNAPKMCAGLKTVFTQETFTTTAVAVCAKDDVFDPKTGIEIARQRARMRAEKKYNFWLFAYFRLMMETVGNIDKALAQSDIALLRYRKLEETFLEG